jgi:hypothetical protein
MPIGRLVRQVADKHQVCTQRSWKRPYGVGLLVAGHDARGPHLYNTCPSGNYWEYKAMAIGARSQVGRAPPPCAAQRSRRARTAAPARVTPCTSRARTAPRPHLSPPLAAPPKPAGFQDLS